jgi:hypothetical protein
MIRRIRLGRGVVKRTSDLAVSIEPDREPPCGPGEIPTAGALAEPWRQQDFVQVIDLLVAPSPV